MGHKPRPGLYWHFARIENGSPVLRSGEPLIVGETLTHTGPVKICQSGLHASKKILDALGYAPGPFVTRCRLNVTERDDDKVVGTERAPIWGYDATDIQREFARHCARDVLHLWDPPDVVVRYLETGDESIRDAAGAAAWAAARAARGAA